MNEKIFSFRLPVFQFVAFPLGTPNFRFHAVVLRKLQRFLCFFDLFFESYTFCSSRLARKAVITSQCFFKRVIIQSLHLLRKYSFKNLMGFLTKWRSCYWSEDQCIIVGNESHSVCDLSGKLSLEFQRPYPWLKSALHVVFHTLMVIQNGYLVFGKHCSCAWRLFMLPSFCLRSSLFFLVPGICWSELNVATNW